MKHAYEVHQEIQKLKDKSSDMKVAVSFGWDFGHNFKAVGLMRHDDGKMHIATVYFNEDDCYESVVRELERIHATDQTRRVLPRIAYAQTNHSPIPKAKLAVPKAKPKSKPKKKEEVEEVAAETA